MLPDVSRSEILWMATTGGAIASGISGGFLEPGERADLLAFKCTDLGLSKPWWDVVWDHTGEGPDLIFVKGELIFQKFMGM